MRGNVGYAGTQLCASYSDFCRSAGEKFVGKGLRYRTDDLEMAEIRDYRHFLSGAYPAPDFVGDIRHHGFSGGFQACVLEGTGHLAVALVNDRKFHSARCLGGAVALPQICEPFPELSQLQPPGVEGELGLPHLFAGAGADTVEFTFVLGHCGEAVDGHLLHFDFHLQVGDVIAGRDILLTVAVGFYASFTGEFLQIGIGRLKIKQQQRRSHIDTIALAAVDLFDARLNR